jgi:hypothetical protein
MSTIDFDPPPLSTPAGDALLLVARRRRTDTLTGWGAGPLFRDNPAATTRRRVSLGQDAGGSELRAVYPVLLRQRSLTGSMITSTLVEVWDDSLRLQCVENSSRPGATAEWRRSAAATALAGISRPEWQAWSVTDNVGTVYTDVGCGGTKGVDQRRYLYATFAPSAPADAAALHVCNDVLGVQFTVELCLPGQRAADDGSGGSVA